MRWLSGIGFESIVQNIVGIGTPEAMHRRDNRSLGRRICSLNVDLKRGISSDKYKHFEETFESFSSLTRQE